MIPRTLLVALLTIFLTACQSSTREEEAKIAELEQAVDANPEAEAALQLVEAYQQFVAAHPEKTEQNARYLYRAAGLLYRMNRYPAAAELLKQNLKKYYNSENTPNAAYLLGAMYDENLKNRENAATVFQQLQAAFPDFEDKDKVASKLSADLPPIDVRLENMYQQIFSDSLGRIDFKTASMYVENAELSAIVHPDDEQAPVHLHKAGEVARSTRAFNKAVEIYQWIIERYPNYEKAPQSMFLLAFTLDNDFADRDEEARVLYEDFIKRYPEDDFAEDARFLINNLGKTDEEIIQSFEQQQGVQ